MSKVNSHAEEMLFGLEVFDFVHLLLICMKVGVLLVHKDSKKVIMG